MIGLYEIRNTINNIIYVGSSNNIEKRITAHKSLLNRGKHHSIKLQRAWDKYSEKYFLFTVLKELEENNLKNEEQLILDKVLSNRKSYYNISVDATAPSRGQKISDKSKAKTSATIRLKFKEQWFKNKHKDAVSSNIVRDNMSKSATKRWADADNKAEQAARTTSWFSNPNNRLKNSEATKAFFANPKNREAARLRQPSKLSESDIEYIREQGKIYGMQIKLCKRFELSPTHISNIVNNKVFNYQV